MVLVVLEHIKDVSMVTWLSFTLLQPELNDIVLHARDYV